jgi:3-hydroxyisobutyrate dehydrogenase-like beta-hydroxyacid dehydrogenase
MPTTEARAAEALVADGVADSIARSSTHHLVYLTNDDAVKSVYSDPQGVFAYLRRGSAIIDMSTVLQDFARTIRTESR